MSALSELPDELQGGEKPRMPLDPDRLAALGGIIAKKIQEDVKARRESGIEDVWIACDEAYLGIDDANRAEFAKARWAKPTSMTGPVTTSSTSTSDNKSTAYVRMTTRYVDMGAGKLSEIVLPIDDKAFSFGPTPVPDLIKMRDDKTPLRRPDGSMLWRAANDDEMAGIIQGNPAAAFMGAQDGMVPQVPVTRADAAKAQLQAAEDAAEKAETRVYDWMVESRYPMQMRKVIHDSARIGVGVLKGPFPDVRTGKAYKDGELTIVERIAPACKWIDPWNLFPQAGCGENIHDGDHISERDFMSAAGLKALKKLRDPDGHPIYLAEQIDKVIEEGPEKCNTEQGVNPSKPEQKNRFTIWYWTGTLNREDMVSLNAPGADELPEEVVDCFCIVTMVNDSPIRATFNPLEKTGHFPYRTFPWSRRAGHWAGVGIAEQIAMPQRAVNAGARAWFNNAGLSAGVQIFLDQHKITPSDNSWELTPNKLWFVTAEGAVEDMRKIMSTVVIPDMGKNLIEIINFATKTAEELSNIPLISQGQTGPQDPQTFGQAELQNNNANTLLRQQAYSLDDHITEPLVDDFYEWLLLDPDVPDDEKVDFKINARGSISMVEKAIQETTLVQMLTLSLDPRFKQNPEKVFTQLMKAKRLDPSTTAYTPEEIAKMEAAPPAKAPQVEVAEINRDRALQEAQLRNQSAEKIAAEREKTAQVRIITDTDRDTAYVEAERERTQATTMGKQAELELRERIALAEFANRHQINLEDAKVQLTRDALKLRTQIRLASANGSAPQVATPAFEPPGRAPQGQAFQK